jgi:serralysin
LRDHIIKGEIMTTTIKIADTAVNTTYQDKTGTTSGTGTGAKFDVTKTNGVYTVVLDAATASSGSGYAAGDTITILGSALGGVNTTNDLILTVATVGTGGKIATFGSVGTGRVGNGTVDVTINVTGTDAVDTYTVDGASTDFTIAKTDDAVTLASTLASNVTFTLADHERVVFNDTAIAYDADGRAGDVYALLAAALGENDVTAEYTGVGISLADAGWTNRELATALLSTDVYKTDAGGVSNETFIKHVYKNVMGTDATLTEVTNLTAWMTNSNLTQADVLVIASELESFETAIGLVGLATTGIEYTPVV